MNDSAFIVIIQDFTQLIFSGGSLQDLIITIYYHDEAESNGIGHIFHHFLASSSNDLNFVYEVWKEFISEILNCYGPSEIALWTDGGPKHFKCSRSLIMWWELSIMNDIKVEYNFFASYHGSNACDGAAAQIKKAVIYYQRDCETLLRNIEDIGELIGNLNNNSSSVITINNRSARCFPGVFFQGITECHRFIFSENGSIFGYSDSITDIVLNTHSVPKRVIDKTNRIKK